MNFSLSRMVFGLGALNLIALVILTGAFLLYQSSQSDVSRTHENKYISYLLADELRQSSDDLTRLARTYVITGDAKYEVQYFDILDIRNGKKPRPSEYHRIYWDFIAADLPKPREDTQTIALEELMKQAGFSEQEFEFLKQAQANSDGLVGLEVMAMNAVKGLFDDGNGNYTVKKGPDFKLARDLMHSNEYHTFKSQIMAPVDKFFVALETRVVGDIEAAERSSAFYGIAALISLILVAFVVGLTFWLIMTRVIKSLGGMKKVMLELSNENTDCEIPYTDRHDEIGDMASAVQVFKDGMIERKRMRLAADNAATEQSEREELERQKLAKEDAANRAKEVEELNVKEERTTKILATISGFEDKISGLLNVLTTEASELQSTADVLVASTDGTRSLSSEVASASQNASGNVQTVASAAEELSASIGEISRQVSQASSISEDAVQCAEETSVSISDLAEAAQKISEVVNMISDIAGQTNLLACLMMNVAFVLSESHGLEKSFSLIRGGGLIVTRLVIKDRFRV